MKNTRSTKQTTIDYFNSTAEDYDQSSDGKFVRCMYDDIVERVLDLKPKTVLDLGCGNGNIIARLQKLSDADYYGLDISAAMIAQAEKRLTGVHFVVGDAEKLPYKADKFDVIVCNASFHHYPRPTAVIREIQRVLKKDGTLILGDPTAPFKLLTGFLNSAMAHSHSGDHHIYHKSEIIGLLSQNGFKVSSWTKPSYKTFILNARLS
ncbi:class I SAM-dependent methyltransferase [Eubacterium sp. 1001713B170207_170306_E7]|uniref:class I SAM-dependent methyltransferase n=1 Tax=Eubacterium sp. 1001713B170207_170306_E7 TaxID=2787097 RepID=UPI001897A427|nr:class I SAM-dependent methyltransferase [Eubacterium sp. 1001713B170207_170306_E7]